MRVFAECDLINHLVAAGFLEIEVHRNPFFNTGLGGVAILASNFGQKADEPAPEKA